MTTSTTIEKPQTELPQAEMARAVPAGPEVVSEKDFEVVVQGALEAVGGSLLFKMRVGASEQCEHVAVAAVGSGKERQFLLLSLPAAGGKLKVETADKSASPLARIAASYAGLMDVFQAAA